MSFAPERLRQLRESHDWTRERLSVESGCSYPSITQYETGVSRPSLAAVERIADALAVSAGDLFDDERATS